MSDLDRLDTLRLRSDAHPRRFGVPYAEALRRAGRLEDAVAVLRTAGGEASPNVLGFGILARCLRDLGHPEEAGIAVRTALALDPDDPVASELAYLVTFAPAQSEAPSAPAFAPEEMADDEPAPAADSEPTPSVFVTQTMAELYVQQGLPGRAVAIYRELSMRAPDDARLAARLGEVVALAVGQEVIASPVVVPEVGDGADDAADEGLVDLLGDLPLLDDFDPIPVVEASPEEDEDAVGPRFAQDGAAPESGRDEPAIPSAFDFSEDAHRVAPIASASDESMLAGLSFEAISLPTPAPDGVGLDLPVGAGPSAREALRQLAHRPVVTPAPRRPSVVPPPRPTARRTGTGTAPSSRAGSPPPVDPTGDDFDQWLRGVS